MNNKNKALQHKSADQIRHRALLGRFRAELGKFACFTRKDIVLNSEPQRAELGGTSCFTRKDIVLNSEKGRAQLGKIQPLTPLKLSMGAGFRALAIIGSSF